MKNKKLKYFDINVVYNGKEKKHIICIDLDFLSFAVGIIETDKVNRRYDFQVNVSINNKFFETASPEEKLNAYHKCFKLDMYGKEKINLPDFFILYILTENDEDTDSFLIDGNTQYNYSDSPIFDYIEKLKEIIIKMYNIK